jgi:hypothetical protein
MLDIGDNKHEVLLLLNTRAIMAIFHVWDCHNLNYTTTYYESCNFPFGPMLCVICISIATIVLGHQVVAITRIQLRYVVFTILFFNWYIKGVGIPFESLQILQCNNIMYVHDALDTHLTLHMKNVYVLSTCYFPCPLVVEDGRNKSPSLRRF